MSTPARFPAPRLPWFAALILGLATLPLQADTDPDPREVLKRAVAAQGQFRATDLKDITISFNGHAAQDGQVHRVKRTFWYRVADGSFKIKTASRTDARKSSERGVNGAKKYWKRPSGARAS